MQDLGTLGGHWSEAYGVSADGSVVVGTAENFIGYVPVRAFRWTAAGGMEDLGTLGGHWSEAYGVSADGSVVVGYALSDGNPLRAFQWTAQGGMQDLGTLGGIGSQAFGVSADGSVVVGTAENASDDVRAFRWTAQGGMQDLNQLYAALLQNGSSLHYANAISPDGRYIVGSGYNATTRRREAYLLDQKDTTTISVEESSEGEFTITISPQPVGDHGWVQVRLGRFEQARVEVRDVLGRLVTVLGDGVLGEQRWQLPQLAAGMYTVVVRTGHGVAARQFVVTR
jgi:probable HAF family extracellular repeat protein